MHTYILFDFPSTNCSQAKSNDKPTSTKLRENSPHKVDR